MRRSWNFATGAAIAAVSLMLACHAGSVLAQQTTPGDVVLTATEDSEQPRDMVEEQTRTVREPVMRGDDELPKGRELSNNPYLAPTAEALSITGDTSGAFVPPTAPAGAIAAEAGAPSSTNMLNILGEDVFNKVVSISTVGEDKLSNVIRLLAEQADLNIIASRDVFDRKPDVTLKLRNVKLGVALDSLLTAHKLAMVREAERVVRIVAREEVDPSVVEMKTVFIQLNWVPASTIEKTLSGLSSTRGASIRQHPESNSIVITDTPPNLAVMRDIVSRLDVPDKQVMIEARMAELIIDNLRSLGSSVVIEQNDHTGNSPALGTMGDNAARTKTIKKTVIDPDTGEANVVETVVNIAASPVNNFDTLGNLLVGSTAAGQMNFGSVVSIFGKEYNIGATLDALENKRVVNILANPRVITLNNVEANINIKREIPYLEAQQGVAQGAIGASVKFKDAGVQLTVTPNITNNGFVRMMLKPEQLIRAGTFSSVQGDVPIIDRRTAVTNVIVKDEDTVVIGGLRELNSGDSRQQVPWFGQVPVFGEFFRKSTKDFLKNELMLFVTPHIIKAPVLAPAEAYRSSRIDAHWDLPDYFFDDSIEQREGSHRGEIDHDATSYQPATLKFPSLKDSAEPEAQPVQ